LLLKLETDIPFHPVHSRTTARSYPELCPDAPLNDSLQSSLFTRLTMVEAEWSAVRCLPAELQVNQ
jgi:hypothetical protein